MTKTLLLFLFGLHNVVGDCFDQNILGKSVKIKFDQCINSGIGRNLEGIIPYTIIMYLLLF